MDPCTLTVFGIIAVAVLIVIGLELAVQKARKAYLASLETLKHDPHNPDLKQATLALGRAYIQALVNQSMGKAGHTSFTELSLMNDINAACAAAGRP